MQVGLIGAGNMARALARGWGDPVLCTDGGSGRARALARELGGEALESNRELAERADVVVLAHKPAQLVQVASEVEGQAKAVISLLAATPLSALEAAFPGVPVFRIMPNTPVEIRRGVICLAEVGGVESELEVRVRALLGRVGRVVVLPEALMDVATGTMGVWPAYVSLIVEAQVDASVKQGMKPELAAELVTAAIEGSAALVAQRDHDTLAVRREVTSPGGMTARGIDALERAGLRTAFAQALEAALRTAPR